MLVDQDIVSNPDWDLQIPKLCDKVIKGTDEKFKYLLEKAAKTGTSKIFPTLYGSYACLLGKILQSNSATNRELNASNYQVCWENTKKVLSFRK